MPEITRKGNKNQPKALQTRCCFGKAALGLKRSGWAGAGRGHTWALPSPCWDSPDPQHPGLCSIPAPQRWHRLQSLVLVGFYLLIPVHDHSARYPQTGYQLTPTQVVRQPDLCLLALQPQQSVPASVCSAPQTRETRSSRAEEAPRLDHPSWTLWVSTSILPRVSILPRAATINMSEALSLQGSIPFIGSTKQFGVSVLFCCE